MGHILGDDGTMDTVVECEACGQESRYNFEAADDSEVNGEEGHEEAYGAFIKESCEDADEQHNCEPTVTHGGIMDHHHEDDDLGQHHHAPQRHVGGPVPLI